MFLLLSLAKSTWWLSLGATGWFQSAASAWFAAGGNVCQGFPHSGVPPARGATANVRLSGQRGRRDTANIHCPSL